MYSVCFYCSISVPWLRVTNWTMPWREGGQLTTLTSWYSRMTSHQCHYPVCLGLTTQGSVTSPQYLSIGFYKFLGKYTSYMSAINSFRYNSFNSLYGYLSEYYQHVMFPVEVCYKLQPIVPVWNTGCLRHSLNLVYCPFDNYSVHIYSLLLSPCIFIFEYVRFSSFCIPVIYCICCHSLGVWN